MKKSYQEIQASVSLPFNVDTLTVSASSEQTFYKSFSYHIQQAYKALERETERIAKCHADWYDCAEGDEGYDEEQYKQHKAAASQQFPPSVVKDAFMDLADTQISDCIHYAKKQWYQVSFNGRKLGAIGMFHRITCTEFAFDHLAALNSALYEKHSKYEYACDGSLYVEPCQSPTL